MAATPDNPYGNIVDTTDAGGDGSVGRLNRIIRLVRMAKLLKLFRMAKLVRSPHILPELRPGGSHLPFVPRRRGALAPPPYPAF